MFITSNVRQCFSTPINWTTLTLFILGIAFCQNGCRQKDNPNKQIPNFLLKFPADSFAVPIGETDFVTEARDNDLWYNAQDFGENNHLGEDWNKNSGANTDCGEPVYATADGQIVFATNAGPGWGNVVMIEHAATDNTKIQSLYGHLETIKITNGTVKKRDLIGTVGNADGRYFCHLHFEIRWSDCPLWNQPGSGYSAERNGWIDPSEFINKINN